MTFRWRAMLSGVAIVLFSGAARVTHALIRHSDVVEIHPDQESRRPALTTDARGWMHLAYVATDRSKSTSDIFYSASADGVSWTPPINVSTSPGPASQPAIVAGSKRDVVIAWAGSRPGDERPDVFTVTSGDGGKSWSAPVNVSTTPAISGAPSLSAAGDGSLHLVWFDTGHGQSRSDIWYSQSIDHGRNWSAPADISNTPGVSTAAGVACGAKGLVAVTWSDTTGAGSSDVWFTTSPDNGQTWFKPSNVSNTPGLSANPAIAIDEKGAIYLAWDDVKLGDMVPDILFMVSRDGGDSFDKYINISHTPGISRNARIAAVGDGHVVLAWVDTGKGAKTPHIWAAESLDGGRTFSEAVDLTDSPGLCDSPAVATMDGKVRVVWDETGRAGAHLRTRAVAIPR